MLDALLWAITVYNEAINMFCNVLSFDIDVIYLTACYFAVLQSHINIQQQTLKTT